LQLPEDKVEFLDTLSMAVKLLVGGVVTKCLSAYQQKTNF